MISAPNLQRQFGAPGGCSENEQAPPSIPANRPERQRCHHRQSRFADAAPFSPMIARAFVLPAVFRRSTVHCRCQTVSSFTGLFAANEVQQVDCRGFLASVVRACPRLRSAGSDDSSRPSLPSAFPARKFGLNGIGDPTAAPATSEIASGRGRTPVGGATNKVVSPCAMARPQ